MPVVTPPNRKRQRVRGPEDGQRGGAKFNESCPPASPLFFHSDSNPALGHFVRLSFEKDDGNKIDAEGDDSMGEPVDRVGRLTAALEAIFPSGDVHETIKNLLKKNSETTSEDLRQLSRALVRTFVTTSSNDAVHFRCVHILVTLIEHDQEWREVLSQGNLLITLMSRISGLTERRKARRYLRLICLLTKNYKVAYPPKHFQTFLTFLIDWIMKESRRTVSLSDHLQILSNLLKSSATVKSYVKSLPNSQELYKTLVAKLGSTDVPTLCYALSSLIFLILNDPQLENRIFSPNQDVVNTIFDMMFTLILNNLSPDMVRDSIELLSEVLGSVGLLASLEGWEHLEPQLKRILKLLKSQDPVIVRHIIKLLINFMGSTGLQRLVCQILPKTGAGDIILNLTCSPDHQTGFLAARLCHHLTICRFGGMQVPSSDTAFGSTFISRCMRDDFLRNIVNCFTRKFQQATKSGGNMRGSTFRRPLLTKAEQSNIQMLQEIIRLLTAICKRQEIRAKVGNFIDVEEVTQLLAPDSLPHLNHSIFAVMNFLMQLRREVPIVVQSLKSMIQNLSVVSLLGRSISSASSDRDQIREALVFLGHCLELHQQSSTSELVLQDMIDGLHRHNQNKDSDLAFFKKAVEDEKKQSRKYKRMAEKSYSDLQQRTQQILGLQRKHQTQIRKAREEMEKALEEAQATAQAQIKAQEDRLKELDSAREAAVLEAQNAVAALQDKESEIREQYEGRLELERRNTTATKKISDLVEQCNDANRRGAALETNNGKLEAMLKTAQDEIRGMEREKRSLQAKSDEQGRQIERYDQDHKHLIKQQSFISHWYNELDVEHGKTKAALQQSKDLAKSTGDKLKASSAKVRTLESNISKKRATIAGLEAKMDSVNRTVQNLRSDLESSKKDLAAKEVECGKLNDQIDELNDDLEEERGLMEQMRKMLTGGGRRKSKSRCRGKGGG